MADSAPAHRINQVEVDVRVPGVVQAEALLAGSNGWCASQLAPTIERVCSELSGPEYIDRIERLELDLGSIAQEDFDIEFAERLELALRAELTRQLGQRSARARAQRASLELVETFARTGNLPWWADARDSEIVAAQLRELVSREPREFGGLLQRLGGDPVAIARLARHASGPTWALVLEAVGSALPQPDVLDIAQELLRATRRASEEGVELALRRAVLGVWARHTEASARAVASALRAELSALAVRFSWQVEHLESAAPVRFDPGRLPESVPMSRSEDFAASAEHAQHAEPSAEQTEHAEPLRRPAPERQGAAERGQDGTGGEWGAPPVGAEPEAPLATHELQSGVQRRVPSRRVPSAASAEPVPEAAVPTGAALRTDAHGRADPAQRQLASLASARRRALAELDQLYVENAGLVLLWPFLERFFLRVGLLDPSSRFHDELSALRAVSLLGQIVFEDPEPPEFLLPLAKVLCGLSPEAHFELELTLNAEQLAECERLLSAAIDHAPSLRALPTAQFRATFLQRRAALSVREGTWLLQVERRAEDALLDRLPWSWSWLKLPWMAGALQVEW